MKLIRRRIYEKIKEHLGKKEITVLIGPRQVGKTTLMSWLRDSLEVDDIPFLWFNLDIETDAAIFRSQAMLLARIKLEFGNRHGVVFIDEIQRKENAGLFLKGIYDGNKHIKLVISGSGSLELKENITESLAGRKRLFVVDPVSFQEFMDFRTDYKYGDQIIQYTQLERGNTEQLFYEYVCYGGYPAVVLAESKEEKKAVLREILSSYLYRDVQGLLNINHVSAYTQLIRILSQQTGEQLKYSSVSQYVNITANTVKDYLWYLNQTYIVRTSLPFYTNPLKELIKEPTIYFVDLGLLNLERNDLAPDYNGPSFGMIFQNFVYNELHTLLEGEGVSLKYWRTKDKAEVDIILDKPSDPIPVEVKYIDPKKPKISRSYHSFIKKYAPDIAFVVTRNGRHEIKVDNTTIFFVPYTEIGQAIKDSVL